jgi:redox-sensitive bicupin YhaK (pirin superfamily)
MTTDETAPDYFAAPCDGIDVVIKATERDLDSFSVRRYLPHLQCRKVGPFVFFDHFGPADFAPGTGLDVRPHPHIGLATISYLFAGEIMHRDSLGFVQAIAPGEVNWMTAGRGIVHSERTGDLARANGQHLHGLQVWVALPESAEETDPAFQHVGRLELPEFRQGEITMRLIAGSAWGQVSPVSTYSPLFYLDVQMPEGSRLQMTDEYAERALHVISGSVAVCDHQFGPFDMAICSPAARVEIVALADTRLVIFGGAPMSERFIWWNFVSSSKPRIEQAKLDWKEGRFASVPGETEFIPLPDKH